MRKICVVIGSRANYSSIKSALTAIDDSPSLVLQIVANASAVLDRYGAVVDLIKEDGFRVDAEVFMLIEGETPATMAKSTGLGLIELPSVFERLSPDIVLTIGDRFETMSTTLAAAYMNIALAHTMGGEVTGTIDESIRHAITKFAHIHFPASNDAARRILALGERDEDIYMVGCPRIDLVATFLGQGLRKEYAQLIDEEGVGSPVDLNQPFVLVSQHPVTTEFGDGESQITETLRATNDFGVQAIVLWPNPDAGSEDISRGIRKWRENGGDTPMRFFKNLPIELYVHLMEHAVCLVGNSSSGIREGAFIGTPVVNIGSRQDSRERGPNVIDVANRQAEILRAMKKHEQNGRYKSTPVYGDGTAGRQIARVLESCDWKIQKTITY